MILQNKPILVVEDDPYLLKVLSNRIKEEGFLAKLATDGEEALALVKENDFSVIFLDLLMPVMSGFEVLKQLKESNNKVPVYVFSNLGEDGHVQKAMDLGAKDFFVKSSIWVDEMIRVLKNELS